MYAIQQVIEAIRDFMELGGDVLVLIAILLLIMWALIVERIIFLRTQHKRNVADAISAWEARPERHSWQAHQIREGMISQVKMDVNRNVGLIETCVALCPLLGLLGTVTGMIEVFDVMAVSGTGNARSMASGVSKATIPTMAGMVAALSGLFFSTWLKRNAVRQTELLNDHLTMDH